jgi:hypothetical protein
MRNSVGMLASIAVVAVSISPVSATMRISGDRGGLITAYAERFAAARARGERVIIDGACLSACTLAIGMLPRRQVCATPNALLGFHAAWLRTAAGGRVTSQDATQAMYEIYPSDVRKWIDHRGGLSERLILLKGRELAAMMPACGVGPTSVAGRTIKRNQLPQAAFAARQIR